MTNCSRVAGCWQRNSRRIPGLHWKAGDGGFFAFVRVDGCTDSLALSTGILDAVDVVTIPGATFGSSGEGYLRLSYGAAAEPTLREACGRLRDYFAKPSESVS